MLHDKETCRNPEFREDTIPYVVESIIRVVSCIMAIYRIVARNVPTVISIRGEL